MKRTTRGFSRLYTEFTDAMKSRVRVVGSSEAGVRRAWVFSAGGTSLGAKQRALNQECRDRKFRMPGSDIISDDTPAYLTPAQARRLAKALLRFANGGRR